MELDIVLKSHLINLYSFALVDQNISISEMVFLQKFSEERGISKLELDRIISSTTGKLKPPDSIEQKLEYLYDFSRMAWADGEISPDEKSLLKKFCKLFGFFEDNEALSEILFNAVEAKIPFEQIINELKK